LKGPHPAHSWVRRSVFRGRGRLSALTHSKAHVLSRRVISPSWRREPRAHAHAPTHTHTDTHTSSAAHLKDFVFNSLHVIYDSVKLLCDRASEESLENSEKNYHTTARSMYLITTLQMLNHSFQWSQREIFGKYSKVVVSACQLSTKDALNLGLCNVWSN